jgi:hypothetical protein
MQYGDKRRGCSLNFIRLGSTSLAARVGNCRWEDGVMIQEKYEGEL